MTQKEKENWIRKIIQQFSDARINIDDGITIAFSVMLNIYLSYYKDKRTALDKLKECVDDMFNCTGEKIYDVN